MPVKGLTQAEIDEATRAQVASGAKSTDRENRLPGETASEANARITAGYKEMTAKPILSQEQKDAGMKVQFVRTGEGGVGEYVPIKPIGYTGPTEVKKFTSGVIPENSKYTTGTSVGFNPDDYKTAEDMQRIAAKVSSGKVLTADEQAFLAKGVTSTTAPVVKPEPAADAATALRKLQSNQPLTNAEKKILGIAVTSTATPTATPTTTPTATPTTSSTATPATSSADAATALRKLQSGQPLTDAEKKLLGITVTPTATSTPTPTPTATATGVTETLSAAVGEDDPRYYTVKVGTTGKTSAQLAAFDNATNTATIINENTPGVTATVDPVTGKITTVKNTGTTSPSTTTTQGNTVVNVNNVTDPATLALIQSLQSQIASLTKAQTDATNNAATSAAAAAAQLAADKATARRNAIDILTERFQRYGLGSLVNKIKELAVDGATEATITLGLQETEEYKQRFKANQERIKKGLAVLNPAEYLNVEDGYRQVLRAYGLKQFDTDDYVSQFIANDMSAAELSNRVVTAVQRVQNADPAISKQLRDFYGIGQADLVAYVLDPNQQFQKIERQVAASEIGVAAGRQGLQTGVSVAEQLAAQGVTEAEAQKGYATIADILPTAEKLSDIYGTTLEGYGQSEAEQEVFNSLASAQRKRQKLTQREVASFSGAAGTNKTSLTTSAGGQF